MSAIKAKKKRPSKLYVVCWGPDSRHLHESSVYNGAAIARCTYEGIKAKAKKLVRIDYDYRMSEGDKITVLSEQIA